MNRHKTYFVDSINTYKFCNTEFYEMVGSSYEIPFETKPTEGEHDYTKCEGCKKNLHDITNILKIRFDGNGTDKKGFPFCCTYHSNLVKIKEFNRIFFVNIPEMVAKKIIYTNQHIINNHSSENWYKKLTDYIEWTVESFGQMPSGCGEPLFLGNYFYYTSDILKKNKDIPTEKRTRILEYLNLFQTPKSPQKTDLNILLGTYEKWLKIFPFELNSYFGNLKQYFEKQLPILSGKPEVNIYTGIAKAKMHTKSSLIESLINLTDALLTQINGITLYEKGLITDTNKMQLELVIESRKMKLKQGYKNNSTGEEQRYRKILKEWFEDEKRFFKEITPILNKAPQHNEQTLSREYRDLNIYFNSDRIKEFEEIEKEMVQKDFFIFEGKEQRKWNKEKILLVSFIEILSRLEILRKRVNGKTGDNARREHRRFFEKRYRTDIKELFKQSKIKASNFQKHKIDFSFIPEIDKI